MKSLKFSAIALLALIAFCAATAFAQSDRGTIRGTVTDPNGAAIANATVTLTGAETGETRSVTTGESGTYVFPELRPALYNITVEATGFQRTTIENFKVAVQVTHTLDIPVQVGAVTNQVTVNAEAEALQADTVVRQTNVTERQVKELPLLVTSEAGGRTPLAFIFLDSNVNGANTGGGTNASQFRVSGGQAQGTEILIDGASTTRQQNGTFFTEIGPGPNAFREFTISTSSYSAEFGNSTGGVVNFTLKSGTNDFHGEGYDLVRNEKLDANSVVNNARGLARNRDNQNNYGFNVGGPIVFPRFGEGTPFASVLKDRAFFFFNYEGYRFRQGTNTLVTVPTVRMRNGDFGELLTDPYVLSQAPGGVRIYNPQLVPDARTVALPGNIIPANLIDPIGQRIAQLFPLPNRSGVFQNYSASAILPNDSNQFTIKTDFNLTSKQRLTVSFTRRQNDRLAGNAPVFPLPLTNIGTWNQRFISDLARVQHDYTIAPNILNHLNIGYSFFDVANQNTTEGVLSPATVGLRSNATQNITFPVIDFPGYGGSDFRAATGLGSTFFTDRLRDGTFQVSDFVTLIAGRQTIKVGADVRAQQFNVRQFLYGGGQFNFRANQTGSDVDPTFTNGNNTGFPIASLLTGATEFSFNSNTSVEPAYRQLAQNYFVQDDVKFTSKLTLNLGLRYDLPGLRIEGRDRYRGFDPNTPNPAAGGRLGAIVGAGGQGGLQASNRTLARTDKTNFGPRLGAAYAFDSKTVIRAGIGLYYAPLLYGNGGSQGELQTGTIGYNSRNVYIPNGRLSTAFLSNFPTIPQVNPGDQFVGNYGLDNLYYFDPTYRSGRTLQYSLDVQRELPYKFVASVGYIGSRSDRLRSNFTRINALPLNNLRLGAQVLNAQFGTIDPTNTNTNPNLGPVYNPVFAAAARSLAQSIGVTLPATRAAVYSGFDSSIAQSLRPFPQYDRITNILETQGVSDYNALQVKLERRFASGIQAGASYTFSRLITNAAENVLGDSPQSGVLQNPFDRSSLKTDSPTHSRNVFVTNFLLELPFGKGKLFLNKGGFIDRLVGGFQVSGIFRYQQGTPLVFSLPTSGTNVLQLAGYYGNLRPNLTGQPILTGSLTPVAGNPGTFSVFNNAAFSLPTSFDTNTPLLLNGVLNPAYQSYYANPTAFFGNAPAVITSVRSRPFFSEDASILKKTRINERVTFEAGAEFFNVFNRVRLGAPDVNLGNNFSNGSFGNIGVANNPRVIQLRGRIIF